MKEAGYNVTVLAALPVSIKRIHLKNTMTYHAYEHIRLFLNIPFFEVVNMALRFIVGYLLFGTIKKTEGLPDIIHAHTFSQAFLVSYLSRKYKIPYLVTEHYSKTMDRRRLGRVQFAIAKAFYRRSTMNIAVSYSQKQKMEQLYSTPFTVVPNFIDISKFHPSSSQRLKKGQPRVKLLSVGNVNENKGFQFIIGALAILNGSTSDYELEIIGEGPYRGRLEALEDYKNNSKYIRLLGSIPNQELVSHYRDADCYISASRVETFGITVLEALASGTPVVVTAENHKKIIENNVYGIHSDRTSQSIANAIRNAINLDATPEVMHDFIKSEYSSETIIELLEKIYLQVTSRSINHSHE
ncbi:MAG: glycosyltransferase family 4 protein [FCB group bacterium]|nr:glycosyltransferase family 4 protein [FCB group bacterium]MBL7028474.1 glycosyltransferase family 4 protein [Candidatus Neomarinimicrobiota bacterium]MBL7121538.1 glycosyltransferase family 4 protein [Candidatus Neomarinimicrobiota bacterium]